ncbi:cupin domain-containing protein [Reyranella sp.]|jgi:quercetin dioxygenase-like cupin family protein|uniref:cupin domain-containing protein n=1 Tax=Reyranella sp. TaxID=1929291 RepID=UPI00271ECDE4|nr:cupin domain-containing protein [Reyranella sp.]MDO8976467.1 cupin domain-containing protein [Reyranella sp.]MDP3239356.1 cupin domain-containing protein [Reyranella sp.]
MDRQVFETELQRDGYDEIVTGTTQGPKHNAEHSHPYDVKAMVVEGAITLAWEGKTHVFRPGEVFTMARGCPHTETFGPEGAVTLVGRKH